ncbi:MAG: hypothetical protein AAFP82_16285, partial [Bacteroidota bacterium]
LAKEKLKLEEAVQQLKNDYDALAALVEETKAKTTPLKVMEKPALSAETNIASALPSILNEEDHSELELELSEQQGASA